MLVSFLIEVISIGQRKPQEYDWFYRNPAWLKMRQIALSRDNGLCVRCLKNKRIVKADVVHHIVHLTQDFSKALQLDNLECLCHSCHNKEHDEKGYGDKQSLFKKNIRRGLKFDEDGNVIPE